jgi:hypothetical protein
VQRQTVRNRIDTTRAAWKGNIAAADLEDVRTDQGIPEPFLTPPVVLPPKLMAVDSHDEREIVVKSFRTS